MDVTQIIFIKEENELGCEIPSAGEQRELHEFVVKASGQVHNEKIIIQENYHP